MDVILCERKLCCKKEKKKTIKNNGILQGTCKERRNVVQRLYTYYSTNKRHAGKHTHAHARTQCNDLHNIKDIVQASLT